MRKISDLSIYSYIPLLSRMIKKQQGPAVLTMGLTTFLKEYSILILLSFLHILINNLTTGYLIAKVEK